MFLVFPHIVFVNVFKQFSVFFDMFSLFFLCRSLGFPSSPKTSKQEIGESSLYKALPPVVKQDWPPPGNVFFLVFGRFYGSTVST